MLRKKSFTSRTAKAVTSAVCESLEPRRLLATYVVPSDPPHTAAYLKEGQEQGQVTVHLDSPTNPAAFTFFEQTGQHVINAGQNADFLFVDQVRPHWKPQAAGGLLRT
jgi:hypothetical protein